MVGEIPVRVNRTAKPGEPANRGFNVTNPTQRGENLSSAQFWHEALGHSSTNTWKHAADRYIDGTLIPLLVHFQFNHLVVRITI